MVVRTEDDQGNLKSLAAYPAVETIHEDSICTKTFMPPRNVSDEICEKARETARQVISTISGRGVFAVEMFLLEDGSILVNEVAPRPHNSGHYTIEAVPYFSQYKAQLYALLDLPIPKQLKPRVASAIMINILGGAGPESHNDLVETAARSFEDDIDVHVHLYGKASKPGRKIGHITITSELRIAELQKKSEHLFVLADAMRAERLKAASAQLRPQESVVKSSSSAPSKTDALVLVTMGSDSDLPVMKAGLDILKQFGVPYEVRITSAHRTPNLMGDVAAEAAGRGIKVAIAAVSIEKPLVTVICFHPTPCHTLQLFPNVTPESWRRGFTTDPLTDMQQNQPRPAALPICLACLHPTAPSQSLVCLSRRLTWTERTVFSASCRCPGASPWPRLASTTRPTLHSLQSACSGPSFLNTRTK